MLTLLSPEVVSNVELAISNNQSGSDECDYCEDADRPAHLNKRCLSNQGSGTHRGSRRYGAQSTKEQQESSYGKHGFAQIAPLESPVRERNRIKIYSLENGDRS